MGTAQPVPDRVRSQRWRRPLLHQRRRAEQPRGGRRGRHRSRLRLEPVRGVLSRRPAGGHHRSADRLPAVGGHRHHGRGVRARRVVAGRSRRWRTCSPMAAPAASSCGAPTARSTTPRRGPRTPAGSPTWCSRSTRPAARRSTTRSTATASCARSSGTVRSRHRPRRTWRSLRSHRPAPTTPAPGSASWPATCDPTRPGWSISRRRRVGAGRARQHHRHEQRRLGVPGGVGAAFVAPAHVGGQRRAAGRGRRQRLGRHARRRGPVRAARGDGDRRRRRRPRMVLDDARNGDRRTLRAGRPRPPDRHPSTGRRAAAVGIDEPVRRDGRPSRRARRRSARRARRRRHRCRGRRADGARHVRAAERVRHRPRRRFGGTRTRRTSTPTATATSAPTSPSCRSRPTVRCR